MHRVYLFLIIGIGVIFTLSVILVGMSGSLSSMLGASVAYPFEDGDQGTQYYAPNTQRISDMYNSCMESCGRNADACYVAASESELSCNDTCSGPYTESCYQGCANNVNDQYGVCSSEKTQCEYDCFDERNN